MKADKAFYDACKEDIATHKCAAGGNSAEGDLSRASVLLCLETAHSLRKYVMHWDHFLKEFFLKSCKSLEWTSVEFKLISFFWRCFILGFVF